MGLGRLHASVWWQGKCGMRWHQLLPTIKTLLRYEDPPEWLVLHCGGNAIGQIPLKQLRAKMLNDVVFLRTSLPNTKLVWSQILPRLEWKAELNHVALEKIRIRLNSMMAYDILSSGGGYIKYPEIRESECIFLSYKVHLSHVGNDFFIHNFQLGSHSFLSSV